MKNYRIAIAAGGTGGHVFPAIALAEQLRALGHNPSFITDHRGKAMIPKSFAKSAIFAASPYGNTRFKRLKGLIKLAMGAVQTAAIMMIKRPHLIIGFGGYPTVAPVIIGQALGKPTMLHEQNAFFGRANRFLAPYARRIALSWPDTKNIPENCTSRTEISGMPVRQAFHKIASQPYVPPHDEGEITILIIGGSLGAEIFGLIIPQALSRLPIEMRKRLHITQQVRKSQQLSVQEHYDNAGIKADLSPFIKTIAEDMANAHLVIGRSGASFVAELVVAGRPALLVPYPHAMDDHQTANAQAIEAIKGGWLIPEKEISAGSVAGKIATLISSPQMLSEAAKNIKALSQSNANPNSANLNNAGLRLAQSLIELAEKGIKP